MDDLIDKLMAAGRRYEVTEDSNRHGWHVGDSVERALVAGCYPNEAEAQAEADRLNREAMRAVLEPLVEALGAIVVMCNGATAGSLGAIASNARAALGFTLGGLSGNDDDQPETPAPAQQERAHHWSGWPGAWCLNCGASDPYEDALADDSIPYDDQGLPVITSEFAAQLAPKMICPEPGSNRCNPYRHRPARRSER